MELVEFIDLLDAESELLSNRATVLQLAQEDVSDYHRGRIMGQIEMLTKIYMRLRDEHEG